MALELSENKRYLTVTYTDNSQITLKPVLWINLDDVSQLQYKLLEEFLKSNGAIGELLKPSNKNVWNAISELVEILPSINNKKLDVTKLDTEDILQLFFTSDSEQKMFVDNTPFVVGNGFVSNPGLSYLCIMNGLNFFQLLKELLIARNQNQPK